MVSLTVFISVVLLIVAVFFLMLFIKPINFSHKDKRDSEEELDAWLTNLHIKDKFNGCILLAKGDEVIFCRSYGYADLDGKKPLSEHSSFNLASLSKQFTAMGIVLLTSRCGLGYDDRLVEYIPELRHYEHVTIRQLLQHTSGMPDYISLAKKFWSSSNVLTTEDMICLLRDKKPELKFLPGSRFEYSNTGYVLLAEIIVRVSGLSFSQFMNESIFRPLGMHNTHVFNRLSQEEPPGRVYGYTKRPHLIGGKKLHDLNYLDGVVGDGGVYSSVYDLYLWHRSLIDEVLLPKSEYMIALSPGKFSNGRSIGYGFGWFVKEAHAVEHGGGWQGFSSYIKRDLDNNDVIIMLDSGSNVLHVNAVGTRFNSVGLNLQYYMNAST